MLKFKVDIMKMLKDKGITTTDIRRKKLLGENALQDIRRGVVPGISSVNKICGLLKKQPGALLEWIPDETTAAADQDKTTE